MIDINDLKPNKKSITHGILHSVIFTSVVILIIFLKIAANAALREQGLILKTFTDTLAQGAIWIIMVFIALFILGYIRGSRH